MKRYLTYSPIGRIAYLVEITSLNLCAPADRLEDETSHEIAAQMGAFLFQFFDQLEASGLPPPDNP